VIPALLYNRPHPLVELIIQYRQRRLALFELILAREAKDIVNQRRDGVAADPEELVLTVVEKVEAVRDEPFRGCRKRRR